MPRFGVYYVPDAEDEMYRLGSQLLGYDVRARTPISMPDSLRDKLQAFDEAWVGIAQPYGFHLTIGEAIDCTWAAIPAVERELEALLECFDPAHPFTLQQRQPDPIGVVGAPGNESLLLHYDANTYLVMLHTLVVARISPLGTGSGYLEEYLLRQSEQVPHRAQQTRLFYSPRVLDNWYPHFTLLNPYMGGDHHRLLPRLTQLFERFSTLTIRSVCLMLQPEATGRWHIYREFRRPPR